jgi:hypothetical protein
VPVLGALDDMVVITLTNALPARRILHCAPTAAYKGVLRERVLRLKRGSSERIAPDALRAAQKFLKG